MAGHTAFFYGTLMAREILYRVCYGTSTLDSHPELKNLASALTIRPAILHDYCRHKVLYADYPAIIPQAGHTVRGTYVTGLTDSDIAHLDLFEGDQYERKVVKVQLLEDGKEGEEKETESYVWCVGVDKLELEEWDYEEFRRTKMHRWADTSEEFEELDNDIVEGHDPTGGRGIGVEKEKKEVEEEEILRAAT